MKASLSSLAVLGLLWNSAHAFDAFQVQDIRVEGLQRISAGTVFSYLPVQAGDTFDESASSRTVRALFGTGFFKDVRVAEDGGVLVIEVEERPAVARIRIEGNDDIETEPLLESLKDVGLAEGRVFDRSLLDKVEQELERQYFSRGKYGVRITTTVTPMERNRVGIDIDVSEGRAARIRNINIVGNRVFSDKELREGFELTTKTWKSFYTKSDQYSKQKLAGDLESLRSFYLDRGYLNFNIDSTQVAITPDKRDIYITVNVSEGEQFRIKEVRLAGNLIVEPEQLFPLVGQNPGDIFSRKQVTATVDRISARLGNEGYAFANINTIPEIDEENREVAVTFFVDPGKRVYVNRINMAGNTRTRDEVLRREMRQMEGGWFSSSAVERSRTRLDRLGFFEEVNVETPAVPGTTDQVDVNYSVTERPSGNLLFGVGFSQSSGVLLNANVSEDNFLGSGKRVALTFNNSNVSTVYRFSYLNPYYTVDGISRGFGVYFRETDASEANLSEYTVDTFGGNVSYGLPINEFNSLRAEVEFQHLDLNETIFSPTEVTDFITEQDDVHDIVKATASWIHDSRNRTIFADRGRMNSLTAELAVPGVGLEFYKISFRHLNYVPLTKYFTLALNAEIGAGEGYGDLDSLPFFEHFFAGGINSVRGFEDNTLGPRDSRGNPLGGGFKLVGNAEILFPPPFFADSRSVRMAAFLDAGNVFANYDDITADELRYSVGLAVSWLSPLGALEFSLARPLNDKTGDEVQGFQFTIGTTF